MNKCLMRFSNNAVIRSIDKFALIARLVGIAACGFI